MSDLILRSTAKASIARQTALENVVECGRRVVERFRREQTGQDMVEYAGVLVVVAVIILAVAKLANTSIANDIINGATTEINKIFGGGSGGSGTTPAGG